jgi:hypothetical protein
MRGVRLARLRDRSSDRIERHRSPLRDHLKRPG